MEVSDSGSKGGERGRVGLQIGVIRADSVKTMAKVTLGDPVCQVRVETHLDRKSSKPLLMALPGPAGCARVSVETWSDFFGAIILACVI